MLFCLSSLKPVRIIAYACLDLIDSMVYVPHKYLLIATGRDMCIVVFKIVGDFVIARKGDAEDTQRWIVPHSQQD